jgi:hypothetical protein
MHFLTGHSSVSATAIFSLTAAPPPADR